MCVNQKFIKTKYGKTILAKCGKCEACLQEKADKRASRIRNNSNGKMVLFVTLTYRNNQIPWIDLHELKNTEPISVFHGDVDSDLYYNVDANELIEDKGLLGTHEKWDRYRQFKHINIYRSSRLNHAGSLIHEKVALQDIYLPYPSCDEVSFKPLKHAARNKVGICYYPDFQDFMKRLRVNISRKNEYKNLLLRNFYVCSEYGPTTCRPHFHALIFTSNESDEFEHWKAALCEAWPYADYYRTANYVEVAIDCAKYVSSYVNCSASVPSVLAQHSRLRPCHHYGKDFGVALEHLSITKIFEAFDRGDMHYDRTILENGVLSVVRVLLPKYAIHRYYPKFKGYSRLTAGAIERICLRPSSIYEYADYLGYTRDNAAQIETMLRHKLQYAVTHGLNKFDYARCYSHIYDVFASNLYRDSFENIVSPADFFQLYDNIKNYYNAEVLSPTLDNLMILVPSDYHYEEDPNKFEVNCVRHRELVQKYRDYDKSKKIKNVIYDDLNQDM